MLDAEAMPESEAAATITGEDSLAETGDGLGAAGSGILQTSRRPSRIHFVFFFLKPNLKPDFN
jgi:hypothetical protein